MPEDLMRYDQLAQNALRGVVRDALRKIQRTGLPGEHHFYIAFNTRDHGGQEVPHYHLHLLGGAPMGPMVSRR